MTQDPLLHPEESAEGAVEPGSSGLRRFLRYAGYPIALILLGVCVWLAINQGKSEDGKSGLEQLLNASFEQLATMAGFVLASIAINGYVFWAILKPFENKKPVGLVRMTQLIAATSLLNYLPMRAGLVGRAAYLKKYHDVGYRVSVLMLFTAAGFTVLTFSYVFLATTLIGKMNFWWWAIVLGLLLSNVVAGPVVMRMVVPRFPGIAQVDMSWFAKLDLRKYLHAFVWLNARLVDVLCNAGRLYIASMIMDMDVSYIEMLTLAAGGMLATLATPLPNGLGVRDIIYTVGGGNAMLGLVDRAIEAVVFIMMGLISILFIHQEAKRLDMQSVDGAEVIAGDEAEG